MFFEGRAMDASIYARILLPSNSSNSLSAQIPIISITMISALADEYLGYDKPKSGYTLPVDYGRLTVPFYFLRI